MFQMPIKRRVFTAGLFSAVLLFAQDWKTAITLPAVDFTGLTPARKTTALRLLRNSNCNCGCDMKLAQCRVEDPQCAYSKGLSAAIVGALKEGKDENAALEAAKASR